MCCNYPIYLTINVDTQQCQMYCCNCQKDLKNAQPSEVQEYFEKTQTQRLKQAKSVSFGKGYGHSQTELKHRLQLSKMVQSGKFKHLNLKSMYSNQQMKVKFKKIIDESRLIHLESPK